MEELVGMFVKITIQSQSGLVIYSGKWIKSNAQFVLLNGKNGPLYIGIQHIKTIQLVVQESNYEKR
jgi:hypothetical protein